MSDRVYIEDLKNLDRDQLLKRLYHVLFWALGQNAASEVTDIINLLTEKKS